MPGKNYLPQQDAEFVVWLENFSQKIQSHAATLNVTPAEVTQFQTYYTQMLKALNDVQASKTSLQSLVKDKNNLFDAAEKMVRDKAIVMKRHPNYTTVIGEDLGIVPPDTGLGKSISVDSQKPTFAMTVLPDMIRIDWIKGEFDGVVIQSRRNSETAFTTLDKDAKSPYEDTRINVNPDSHEARYYRLRYLLDDKEVGQWSDELKVYCML